MYNQYDKDFLITMGNSVRENDLSVQQIYLNSKEERVKLNRAGENRQEIMNDLRKDGYSEIVIDHWLTPRNFGQMQKYDGHSNKFTGSCGDSMWVWIKVNNDIIQEASYISDVCIGSISCGSILTEMIKGKSIGSALRISQDDILKELGGLPAQFAHCAKLAKDTLNLAIIDYNAYKNTPWKRAYQKE